MTETEDGLRITPRPLTGGLFHTYADHRMVMAGALLGLRAPGLVVEDPDTVAKTLPEFVELWHGLVDPGRPDPMSRRTSDYDESDVRIRPSRRGSRPRSKDRPAHEDAVPGFVIGVDRGRYTRPRGQRRWWQRQVTARSAS